MFINRSINGSFMRLNHVWCAIVNSVYGGLYLLWAIGFLIVATCLVIFDRKDPKD
jgi:hypothetical protein